MAIQKETSTPTSLEVIFGLQETNELKVALQNGKWIQFQDNTIEATSGQNKILFALMQKDGRPLVLYAQIPYGYPIPEKLKAMIREATESPKTEFLNTARDPFKQNMQRLLQPYPIHLTKNDAMQSITKGMMTKLQVFPSLFRQSPDSPLTTSDHPTTSKRQP